MRDKFLSLIGDQQGALTYEVVQDGQTWKVSRLSISAIGSASTTVAANGMSTERQANLILWHLKERNAATIAATQSKLDSEVREQSAILQALGSFNP